MLALLLLLLCLPSLVFAQGTVKSRTQAGDGTPITDTVSGRLDVTVQTGVATESTLAGLNGKFPAAFASADNIANQTATAMHGFLYAYDGTTWDRLLSTSGALHVNVQNASLAVTGTFWQATQPISGTVTVTDGSGALNVIIDSGTVTAVTTITNPVTVTDGAGALNVICDSGCGSGTQYAEDTAHVSGDQLSMAGVVQQTADAALAANGDRTALQVDENGLLKVNIKAGSGSSDGIVKDGTGDTGQANVTSGRLHVDGSGVTQPVSGTVTVTDGAGALNVICDSGCGAGDGIVKDGTGDTTQANVSSGRLHVDASGATVPVSGTFWQATQPVSGTVTANAGTGTFFDGIIKDGTGDTTQANVSTGRLQVDGSGVTQPVSGTVTVTDGAGALNVIVDSSALPSGAATAAKQPALGTAGAASTDVITVQGIASGTPLIVGDGAGALNVICDSGCGSGTQYAEDAAETAGAQLSMAGSVRRDTAASSATTTGDNATINTDATGRLWTNTELPDAAALADDTANPTVPSIGTYNMCWDGATWDRCAKATVGNGAVDTGTQRVTIANDSTGTVIATQATAANLNVRTDSGGATGAAPPARAEFSGAIGSGATGGFLKGITAADSFANISISTATTTLIVTGVSGRHVRITGISLVTAAANNVAFISGTGATCGTGTTGMTGGTTAASGYNFAANGGIAQGTGLGEINRTNATGDSVCIITSAATQLSGRLSYAIY